MKKYLIILFVCVAFASCKNETTKATEVEIGTTVKEAQDTLIYPE